MEDALHLRGVFLVFLENYINLGYYKIVVYLDSSRRGDKNECKNCCNYYFGNFASMHSS